jgi:hypothetical protein
MQPLMSAPYTNGTMPPMLDEEITDTCAWKRGDISCEDWLIPFSEAGVAELDTVVDSLRKDP